MFKNKIRVIAAAGAASLLMLAACGGQTDPTTTETNGSGGEQSGATTINFWSWNPDATTVQPYLDAFSKDHPDIKVEHRFIQYSDYVNTTQLALQSDSGPDVFGLQVGALTEQFAPLAADLAPVMAEHLGDDWQSQMTATEQLAVDGKQVALPWMITGGGLVWANQPVVDELGLTVPTNLTELRAFCETVNAAGKACLVQGAKDAWQNIDVYQAIINQIAPGKFYEATAGEADFSSAEFVQAFDVWKSLFDDGIFQEGALGMTAYPDANDAFKKGEAALIAFGTWQNADTTQTRLDQYSETYGDAFDTSTIFMPYEFPQVVDGGTTGLLFGGPDVGFAVASNSKNMDAANTFVTWMTASAGGQEIIAKTVQQPALNSVPLDLSDVVSDEQVAALEAQGPALQKMIGQRELANADVRTALGDALSAVASGQQSSAEAAAAVQAVIESVN